MAAYASLLALTIVNVLLFTLFRINSELKPEQASFGAKSGDPPKEVQIGLWVNDNVQAFPWQQICVKSSTKAPGMTLYSLEEQFNPGPKEVLVQFATGSFSIHPYIPGWSIQCLGSRQDDDNIVWHTINTKPSQTMTWTYFPGYDCN